MKTVYAYTHIRTLNAHEFLRHKTLNRILFCRHVEDTSLY